MKKLTLLILLILIASCAPQPEVQPPPPETKLLPPPPPVPPEVKPAPKIYYHTFACEEDTAKVFNKSGIEVLPFVRLFFFDMDDDGQQELIAGSKDGALRLYKRTVSSSYRTWEAVKGYFAGVRVGAFASPAVADIDMDGRPELIVGTGGFSSESGRVIVYRNAGTPQRPLWKEADMAGIDVGDDAVPAVIDANGDGRPDLIIGNSTGNLFLYRNTSKNGTTFFVKDSEYFRGISVGMYGMPAATLTKGKVVIIAGNSMGKLYLLERPQNGRSGWQKTTLKIAFSSFAAPAFLSDNGDAAPSLIISDGNGQIHYFRNSGTDYRSWEERYTFFAGRIMPGPACTPSVTEVDGKPCMVTGNINGELKLFEFQPYADILPWVERPDFFRGIKLSGFSRGTLAVWRGKNLLITGQQDGFIRAFLDAGTPGQPVWKEQKDFFRGVPKTFHASPTVFDIDEDGSWELVVGDVDGRIKGYKIDDRNQEQPAWKKIENVFDRVKADRYASPALIRDGDKIYLFVGGQDGSMDLYTAQCGKTLMFQKDVLFNGIQVNNHSSPAAYLRNGIVEMSVGDYNGNLRHFACRKTSIEVQDR